MTIKKITLTGDLGSGKSRVTQLLNEILSFEVVSVGDIQRKIAEELNLSTIEFNRYMESHPEFDYECDKMVKQMGSNDTPLIFDSRLAWHFVPESFKVYLSVDINTAAIRVFHDKDRINENYFDIEVAKTKIGERKESENHRFKHTYGLNLSNFDNYDLVIDTTHSSPHAIANCIYTCYNRICSEKSFNKFWFSPKSLIPTQGIRGVAINKTSAIMESIKENGYNENYPVYVIQIESKFYIYDGHKRTSSAIFNNIDLIPVIIIATSNQKLPFGQSGLDYIIDNYNKSNIYDWEDMHDVNFRIS